MSIFVIGATGVLGRSVTKLLVEAGHQVRGLARSEANVSLLRSLGAEPVAVDLFDPAALKKAITGSQTLLHLATKIPPGTKVRTPSGWAENDRLRRAATRYLVEAALAADVETLIYPSVVLIYPDSGDRWVDTTSRVEPTSFLQSTLQAEAEVERFAKAGRRGISLRMGQFIGPESSHSQEAFNMAASGLAAMFGTDDAYQSSIWVEDAARAVIAAIDRAPSGLYDVVDDLPLRRTELLAAMAAAVGRKRLYRLPTFLARLAVGPEVASLFARSQRVSNRKFKAATGWSPRVSSAREGWLMLGAELRRAKKPS